METPKLQGHKPRTDDALGGENSRILPLVRSNGKGTLLRSVLSGFILLFLMICIGLFVRYLAENRYQVASTIGKLWIEQGMRVPKTENAMPNLIK